MSELNEQISARRRARCERLASLSAQAPQGELSTRATPERLMELAVGLALGFMLEGERLNSQDEEKPDSIYEQAAWRDLVARLKVEVAALPERERAVLQHHYEGLLTFDEIGNLLGLSGARVSQLHKSALATLRKPACARDGLIPDGWGGR